MKRRARKFTRWLFRRIEDDSPVGDLANDAYHDSEWPCAAENFSDFYHHLMHLRACRGAMAALVEAYGEYTGIEYVTVFENCFDKEDEYFDIINISDRYPPADTGKTYIYFMLDDWTPFYVGQTVRPAMRLRQHVLNPGIALRARMTEILEAGRAPLMKIADCVSAADGTIYERAYIDMLRANYFVGDLLNINLVTR